MVITKKEFDDEIDWLDYDIAITYRTDNNIIFYSRRSLVLKM